MQEFSWIVNKFHANLLLFYWVSIRQDFFTRDIGGLCALFVGFRLLAFFALLIKTYQND
jgi:hypothetical protein